MKKISFLPFLFVLVFAFFGFISASKATNQCLFDANLTAKLGDRTKYIPKKSAFIIHAGEELKPSISERCAIESFLMNNPSYTLYVLSHSWRKEHLSSQVSRNQNLVFLRDWKFETVFKVQEELSRWYKSGVWDGKYRNSHLAYGARLALLYSCGGLYFDTDMIFRNSVQSTSENFVAISEENKTSTSIGSGIIRVSSERHDLIRTLIQSFVSRFDPNLKFDENALGRIYKDMPYLFTKKPIFSDISSDYEQRARVSVLEKDSFFPISKADIHQVFQESSNSSKQNTWLSYRNIALHLWQSIIKRQLYLEPSHYFHHDTKLGDIFENSCSSEYKKDKKKINFKPEVNPGYSVFELLKPRITIPYSGQIYSEPRKKIYPKIIIGFPKFLDKLVNSQKDIRQMLVNTKNKYNKMIMCVRFDNEKSESPLKFSQCSRVKYGRDLTLQVANFDVGQHVIVVEIFTDKNSISKSIMATKESEEFSKWKCLKFVNEIESAQLHPAQSLTTDPEWYGYDNDCFVRISYPAVTVYNYEPGSAQERKQGFLVISAPWLSSPSYSREQKSMERYVKCDIL